MAEAISRVERLRSLLASSQTQLQERFHVEQIGIFGSSVRGEDDLTSDVDILVVFERGHKDFFNYMRLKEFLEDLLMNDVDLVPMNAIKPRLRQRILSEVEFVG